MAGISFKQKGDLKKLDNYLTRSVKITKIKNIEVIAEECIRLLSEATPKDSGLTAASWKYEIENEKNKRILIFSNTNVVNGISVAFLIDIGHATGSGVWVEGKNYIKPIVKEAYDKILNNARKELKRL